MDATEKRLKELTEAHGVPGAEYGIRKVMAGHLEKLGTISSDKMGSLICEMDGKGPRILLMAHMDEIGLMVRHITKDGFIRFFQLGGWWDQVLLGHRVIVKTRKGDLVGVIGASPPHLLNADQRKKLVTKDDMYIDIGVGSKEEVEELGVRVGDYIVPDSHFEILANGKTYVAKAFDDRVGCGVMIDAMKKLAGKNLPNHLFGVASTQEEVGTRGAETSVTRIKPDICFVLESGIAGDVPGIGDEVSSEKLGGGPSINFYDALMIAHNKLRDFVFDVAEEEGIPLQDAYMVGGATDGTKVQRFGDGVPTIAINVPARHIHSHNSIIHRDDYDATVKLLVKLVQRLDQDTVNEIQAFDY
jgi:putative aminopeptidase FrvX